ncbi:hypothetical protein, partial [Nitratifractor sp.]
RRIVRHPLLTYINWSYDRSRHLDVQQLSRILREFDETYGHIYMRLFNEVPREIVRSFMQEEGIEESSLNRIYDAMNRLGVDLRPI